MRYLGGLHLALKRSLADAKVIHAFDWDPSACKVYAANYGENIAERVLQTLLCAA